MSLPREPERRSGRLQRLRGGVGATALALALILLALSLFVETAEEVFEGETMALDRAVLLSLRSPHDPADPWGPAWLQEIGRDFTALGGVGVLTLVITAVVGHFLLSGRRATACYVAASVLGGLLASSLLKGAFERPRPDLVAHGSWVYTSSFPSGHAMLAAITYLTLGMMLARAQRTARLKSYTMTVAVLITLLVGVSRVYLGVHWPTDVVAGWLAGASWALLCWLAARALRRRGLGV